MMMGRDDGARETDEDKRWWAMGFSCGFHPMVLIVNS
jgi:hypothetical protein